MQFLMLIPAVDEVVGAPYVYKALVDADSRQQAERFAGGLEDDARQLMDLVLGRDAFDSIQELNGLEGDELLERYGIRFGDIEILETDERHLRRLPRLTVALVHESAPWQVPSA